MKTKAQVYSEMVFNELIYKYHLKDEQQAVLFDDWELEDRELYSDAVRAMFNLL